MKTRCLAFVMLFFLPLALPAMSGEFDGSRPLLGTVDRIVEINTLKIIDNVDPDTVGLPRKFVIDFKANIIRPTKDNVVRRTSKIKRIDHIENKLILQGAEEGNNNDGLGWSMSISKQTGKMVLTASGDGIAYVVFGACAAVKDDVKGN